MSALMLLASLWMSQLLHAENPSVEEIQPPTLETLEVEEPSLPQSQNWPVELGLGGLIEFQKTVDAAAYEPDSAPFIQLGLHKGRWVYSLDAWVKEQSSATGNLKIESRRSSLDFSVLRLSQPDKKWSPFLGLGVGGYIDQVTTQFGAAKDTVQSDLQLNVLGKAGARFRFLRVMYSDVTFRINKRETSRDLEWAAALSVGFHL